MVATRKILLAQKKDDINYNMNNGSPFFSLFIHDILYPFINSLMDVKSQCELIPLSNLDELWNFRDQTNKDLYARKC